MTLIKELKAYFDERREEDRTEFLAKLEAATSRLTESEKRQFEIEKEQAYQRGKADAQKQ